ncbi:FG-GAP-like repeat-containing protein [Phenylobacterium sp. J367]|uniref:FG-GAP-like repeat-containing protein n=1 Tax=Phenylobacterium sp. J367 TaxID=2898435 RepID=UPI0021508606|nr:FG-GAP-like repeat-containing protein [Phenylobacterium sp. J367]MCR5880289.1 FG-GAP-like repeat-containing protein [Phenylobacterium sp. J367]
MPTYYTSRDFSAPIRSGYETGFIHEVAVADFDGDGKTDFALTYFLYPLEDRGTPVRFFSGDGAGGFTDRTSVIAGGAPTTVHAREVVVGDFNKDGRPDLFVADHGYDTNPFPGAQNALLLSSGATGVSNATGQLPQVSDYSHSAKAADIDGDGDLDIYVGNGGGGTAWTRPFFLINNGQGGFTQSTAGLPPSLAAAGGPNHWSEAFVDVDGDGDKDLFLGSSTNTGSRLLINNGAGVFTDSLRDLPRGDGAADAVDIQVLDANRDGRQDLIISYTLPVNGAIIRQIQLLVNDGQGGFTDGTATALPASMLTGDWVRRIHLADVNGDGLTDLVLSNASSTPFYLNDGSGHFIEMPNLLPGNQYDQITPGDFNGDGRTDFLAWRGKWDGSEQMRIDLGVDPGTAQPGTAASEGFMGDNDAETINAGAGNDTLVGGGGQDYLRGDEGDDRIAGGDGFDDTHGNMGNDTVSGGQGPDWVVGGKDNDVLYGDEDHDVVYGNIGNDVCHGGEGNDVVRGGQNDDIVRGEAGDDWLAGDRGDDTVTGGAGADIFHTHGEAGLDRVTDFNRAEGDRVYLLPGTQYTVAQEGADVAINMVGGGKMVLVGVQLASLTGDWIFGA